MRRRLIIVLAGLSIGFAAESQITLWDDLAKANKKITTTVAYPDSIVVETDAEIDSSLVEEGVGSSPEVVDSLFVRESDEISSSTYFTNDLVYKDRLEKLPQTMNLTYNETVRRCIELYVMRLQGKVAVMLGLREYYFPMIERALASYNLPEELKYLAIVESALDPVAHSRMGATGLWQFMWPTGKSYGLEINNLVDERRDPVKSTEAACRYLRDLYNIYEDWNLVIAAYNCGPGNVNKAIRRANGERDFWEIYQHLPRETRTYLPLFIAANYAMNYYEEHGIQPDRSSLPLSIREVRVDKFMHFEQIATVARMDKDLIKTLNPQYKQEIIPGNRKSYVLMLPSADVDNFLALEDSISNYNTEYFASKIVVERERAVSSKRKIIHRVRQGDNLNKIASRYGVSALQMRKWNGMRSSKVTKGSNLVVYVNAGGSKKASYSKKRSVILASGTEKKNKIEQNGKAKRYKVRQGDSFYSISRKYPGVTADDLMKINKFGSKSLKVGQVIKIPKV